MDKRIFAGVVVLATLLTGVIFFKNRELSVETPIPSVDQSLPSSDVPPPPEPPKPTLEDALNSITADQLKEYVTKLTSSEFEGRGVGRGADLAAKYIGETLNSFGLPIEYHRFQFNQRKTQNVYAWIEGKTDEVVVVGAHYDHLGRGYPGADDNASGTACVMAMAKACALLSNGQKEKIFNRTLVFQLYSAEEYGLYGSRFYCNYPTMPKNNPSIRKHVFMLNLDMVGYLGQGYYRTEAEHDSAPDIGTIVNTLAVKYPFAKSITSRGSGGSDQQSFLNAGVPVAWLHTGMHPNYHKMTDTADRLNYNGMEQIAKYGLELVLSVTEMDKAVEFNRTGFQALEYTKDHGVMPYLVP